MNTSLQEDLLELRKLRADEKVKKDQYETAKTDRKEFEAKVMERMEIEKCESTRVDGTLFVPTSTTFGTVRDRTKFLEWARDEDESLFEEKERAEILNQIVREKLDNEEPLPPGVGYYVREYISQRAG